MNDITETNDEILVAEQNTEEELETELENSLSNLGDYIPSKSEVRTSTRKLIHQMLKSLPLRPVMNVLDFSENYRILPTSNAARAGMLYKAYAYQRDVLSCITDPKWDRIVIMFAAQTGKSEMLNNAMAYFMYMDPSEMLMVLPTEESAEEYVKRRVDPMIRDNWYLRDLVNSRDSRNNVMNKYFIGGSLSFVGSGSPTKLASKPIRILICDEVDRYLDTKEGSTLKLAQQRTATFVKQRKILIASTPTFKGKSLIEDEFKASAQHHFYVPCHTCGHEQILIFDQITYSKPEDAMYECVKCRDLWTENQRRRNIKKGRWVLTGQGGARKSIGFHLSALYSPYLTLSDIVEEKLRIKTEKDKQAFENTILCQTYEPVSLNFEPEVLEREYELYTPKSLPAAVRYVTCAVDVQGNRMEFEFRGWGNYGESWGIQYIILHGDTSRPHIWGELHKLLMKNITFTKDDGSLVYLVALAIDKGFRTHEVEEYCKGISPQEHGFLAIPVKGASRGTTMVGYYTITALSNTFKSRPMLNVNTFECKREIYYRLLSRNDEGCRLTHFASADYGYHPEYYKQLTSEKLQQTTTKTGEIKYEFIKDRARNEALDIFVYNFVVAQYFENVILPRIRSKA